MKIEIEEKSGFCFGVIKAIQKAEKELQNKTQLYCLGDIVHNGEEVKRLEELGLKTISKEEFFQLKNCKVLIRAHGEPPETYEYAQKNNIELLDATCPVVLRLQNKIRNTHQTNKNNDKQIVIFGKSGHAEVVGLNGQTNFNAIIVNHKNEIDKIDFSKPVSLYSQTTKNIDEFNEIVDIIGTKIDSDTSFTINDTVCRQVSNRVPQLKVFAQKFDIILFVSGKKSSNGKYLFNICKNTNERSYMISNADEIKKEWFENVDSVGISGATSTPKWLMIDIAMWINENINR